MVTNPVTTQFPVPQVTCAVGAPVVSAPTIPVLNNQMEQMVSLMRENENRQARTNRPPTCFTCQQQGHYSWNCPNVNRTLAQDNEQTPTTGSLDNTMENREAAGNVRP
ncbi:15705_t:CDS:2 [Gigaspora rosea]|nr:15705_t:CDS:2 [Gigaspora rosea]